MHPPAPPAGRAHVWEAPQSDEGSPESDWEADPMTDADAAAGKFMDILLDAYLQGTKVSAKTFCLLCFWGAQGGLRGEAWLRCHAVRREGHRAAGPCV